MMANRNLSLFEVATQYGPAPLLFPFVPLRLLLLLLPHLLLHPHPPQYHVIELMVVDPPVIVQVGVRQQLFYVLGRNSIETI